MFVLESSESVCLRVVYVCKRVVYMWESDLCTGVRECCVWKYEELSENGSYESGIRVV